MYIYEMYEENRWRRFTEEELEVEKKIRKEKGLSWFKTFWTSQDLGETVHLKPHEIRKIRDRIILSCSHCGNAWSYRGFSNRDTSCPKCQGYVNLLDDKIYVDLPPMGTFHGPLPEWAMERGHPFDDHGYYLDDRGALMVRCPEESADRTLLVYKCTHEEEAEGT